MNDCFQHASVDAVFGIVPTSQSLALPLAIPDSPSLAGVDIDSQAAVLANGLDPLGITTSHGGV